MSHYNFFRTNKQDNSNTNSSIPYNKERLTNNKLSFELEQSRDIIIKLKTEIKAKSNEISLLKVNNQKKGDELQHTLKIIEDIVKHSDQSTAQAMSIISHNHDTRKNSEDLPQVGNMLHLTDEQKSKMNDLITIQRLREQVKAQGNEISQYKMELDKINNTQKSQNLCKWENTFIHNSKELHYLRKENEEIKVWFSQLRQDYATVLNERNEWKIRSQDFKNGYKQDKLETKKKMNRLEELIKLSKDKEITCKIFHIKKSLERARSSQSMNLGKRNPEKTENPLEDAAKEMQKMAKTMTELKSKKQEQEDEWGVWKRNNNKLKEDNDKWNRKITEQQGIIQAITSEKNKAVKTAEDLRTTLNNKDKSTMQVSSQWNEKNSVLKENESVIKLLREGNAQLKREWEEARNRINELESVVEQEKSKTLAIKEIADENEEKCGICEDELRKESEKVEEWTKENEKLRKEVIGLEKVIQGWKEEISELKTPNQNLFFSTAIDVAHNEDREKEKDKNKIGRIKEEEFDEEENNYEEDEEEMKRVDSYEEGRRKENEDEGKKESEVNEIQRIMHEEDEEDEQDKISKERERVIAEEKERQRQIAEEEQEEKERQRQLEEEEREKERQKQIEEEQEKERQKQFEEEKAKEIQKQFEEEQERQRQIEQEEQERQKLLEEEQERQRQIEEEQERQRQIEQEEQEKEKQRQIEEEKERQRQIEQEEQERQRQIEQEKERQRQIEQEEQERQRQQQLNEDNQKQIDENHLKQPQKPQEEKPWVMLNDLIMNHNSNNNNNNSNQENNDFADPQIDLPQPLNDKLQDNAEITNNISNHISLNHPQEPQEQVPKLESNKTNKDDIESNIDQQLNYSNQPNIDAASEHTNTVKKPESKVQDEAASDQIEEDVYQFSEENNENKSKNDGGIPSEPVKKVNSNNIENSKVLNDDEKQSQGKHGVSVSRDMDNEDNKNKDSEDNEDRQDKVNQDEDTVLEKKLEGYPEKDASGKEISKRGDVWENKGDENMINNNNNKEPKEETPTNEDKLNAEEMEDDDNDNWEESSKKAESKVNKEDYSLESMSIGEDNNKQLSGAPDVNNKDPNESSLPDQEASKSQHRSKKTPSNYENSFDDSGKDNYNNSNSNSNSNNNKSKSNNAKSNWIGNAEEGGANEQEQSNDKFKSENNFEGNIDDEFVLSGEDKANSKAKSEYEDEDFII